VTGTVESIPLIASSIISKKIAAGAHGIILDVKIGSGAFMKSKEKAFELAEILVRIGQKLGRTVKVILTDMHQPLGYTIGNALEVKEAIRTLKGKGPEDLKKLVLELAKELLLIAGKTEEEAEALKIVEENLSNGSALAKFRQLVEAQGGDPRVLDDLRLLTSASFISSFKAEKQGYVQEIAADKIGRAAQLLGAGRLKKEDRIDPGAGIELCKKIGDYVQKGERLALLYTNRENSQGKALSLVKDAFTIGENFIQPPPLFYGKLG
ncbi:MAG: thymidine phosphorylase, partial [Firmicutes bacterium]|nr:thymidine phosphorylase [Bacillota bacterium]